MFRISEQSGERLGRRNPITIEQLEMLDAIDRRGSFARAAEELGKATSALSYGVQKLEEQLDVVLFRRQGRRSVLTPAGQLVLEEGRRILAAASQLTDKAREVATGWEPHLRIAVESLQCYSDVFSLLADFLAQHPAIELDISECVLNGGWEALEQERVDLILGAPGPVPRQMGYRAVPMAFCELVPVIAADHPEAALAADPATLQTALPGLRRVVTHDTSTAGIVRTAGLGDSGTRLYVQNMDQKVQAILAGLGIGHLPRHRVEDYLRQGALLELVLGEGEKLRNFIAWKVSSRGGGLQSLTAMLIERFCDRTTAEPSAPAV
jgi:DNA-binding transcriptional LysR family regulator